MHGAGALTNLLFGDHSHGGKKKTGHAKEVVAGEHHDATASAAMKLLHGGERLEKVKQEVHRKTHSHFAAGLKGAELMAHQARRPRVTVACSGRM